MSFLWPNALLLLLIVPLLLLAYVLMLRRRRRTTVRFSSLSLIHAAAPKFSRWRRHVPFALFLTALTLLITAISRPVSIVSVPAGQTTIVLVMDVSRSMCSTDIEPNRLLAAEAAALAFIQDQPSTMLVGLVAFAGFAEVIQAPTSDHKALKEAIESLLTGRRTAIGSGILKAIDVIAEVDENVAPSIVEGSTQTPPTPVLSGVYAPEIIVLLTDGASNAGPSPLDAAQQAADRGIRVYTIGFGTEQGSANPYCESRFVGGGAFDSGGGFGGGFGGGGLGGFRRGIDEETLREVAAMTGGEYYSAESAGELRQVFADLPTSLIMRHEVSEVSAFFTAAGALLVLAAIGLAMRWQPLL